MPVIGHVSNGSSSDRAISYGFGKNQRMKNNTEKWLANHGVKVEFPYIGYSENSRAVWVGGTHGIDGYHAAADMAFNQRIHNQTEQKNQVKCIVQSFSHNELDPLNPADWEKANKLGVEFAKKAYPDYQCAVFTQLDNENHLIHNHIYVDKVNLKTGHKLKEPRRIDDYRKINDELAKEQGWKVISPKRERTLNAENQKKKPGRKAFVSYVKETVDRLMMSDEITSKADFIKALDEANITYDDKNKMNRFVSKTEKDKSGKAFVVRGKRLGTDYEKEAIDNELERRNRKQKIKGREQGLTIEKQAITSDLQQSSSKLEESEASKRIAETGKQQAQSQQSRIAELVAILEHKANELRKRLERFRAKIRAKVSPQSFVKQAQEQEPYTLQYNSQLSGTNDFVTVNPKTKTIGIGNSQGSNIKKIPEKTTILKRKELKNEIDRLSDDGYHVLNDIDGHEKGSLDDIKAFNNELPENAILEKPKQPKKPAERDEYGLNRVQRHIIDDGNKLLREHGLSDLQISYDGKTLQEHEAEKNHKVAKPLKLTKEQIQTVYVANKKYLSAGLPSYRINYDGLSYKYNFKFQRQQKQKTAENQAVQANQQSKKQPVRRHSSHRLQIKHPNQNQNKNIDRGPKM